LRYGYSVFQYEDKNILHKVGLEADYFGLVDLHNEIERRVKAGVEIGSPIAFDSWVRFQGDASPRMVYNTWNWKYHSGRADLLETTDALPSVKQNTFKVVKSGTYLLTVQLFHAPNPKYGTVGELDDETHDYGSDLCGVRVKKYWRSNFGDAPAVCHFGIWENVHALTRDHFAGLPVLARTATGSAMEIIDLVKGDEVMVEYPEMRHDPSSSLPMPNTPAHLCQNCSFMLLSGTAAALFARKPVRDPGDKASPGYHGYASWNPATLFPSDVPQFAPKLLRDDSALQIPTEGTYLIFGQIAITVSESTERWRQMYSLDVKFRVMASRGSIVSLTKLVEMGHSELQASLDDVSSSAVVPFFDVLPMQHGFEVDLVCQLYNKLENYGTEADHKDGRASWQSMTVMRLSPSTRFDRYEAQEGTNGWKRALPGSACIPFFQPGENWTLVVPESAKSFRALIMLSFPLTADQFPQVGLKINDNVVSISRALQESGLPNIIREIVELGRGDRVSIVAVDDQFVSGGPLAPRRWAILSTCRLCAIQLD